MNTNKHNPVFEALNKFSVNDLEWAAEHWNDKALSPYVLQRWLTGCSSARQVVVMNEVVNKHVFTLSQHKELLMKLLTVSPDGIQYRYKWSKPKQPAFPETVALISRAYECSEHDAVEYLSVMTDNDVMNVAVIVGLQSDAVKKIGKELKSR